MAHSLTINGSEESRRETIIKGDPAPGITFI